jgi:stage II sporulation protein AA (anti-sigma F factor antagonist)
MTDTPFRSWTSPVKHRRSGLKSTGEELCPVLAGPDQLLKFRIQDDCPSARGTERTGLTSEEIGGAVQFDQAQPFEIRQERNGEGSVTVWLSGELDMVGCEDFEAAVRTLNGSGLREITIDLAELTFIDSSGIRALLESKRLAEENGQILLVRVPDNGQVRQVLELTGVDNVLDGAGPG